MEKGMLNRKVVFKTDKSKAHNATEYIPGLNIATCPVTRVGKRFVKPDASLNKPASLTSAKLSESCVSAFVR